MAADQAAANATGGTCTSACNSCSGCGANGICSTTLRTCGCVGGYSGVGCAIPPGQAAPVLRAAMQASSFEFALSPSAYGAGPGSTVPEVQSTVLTLTNGGADNSFLRRFSVQYDGIQLPAGSPARAGAVAWVAFPFASFDAALATPASAGLGSMQSQAVALNVSGLPDSAGAASGCR